MTPPIIPDSHHDLLDEQVAALATVTADGYPQVTGVWFLYEDGQLRLSLNTARYKTRNLRERPKCSLFLLDLQNPYRYLEVRGEARIEPDDEHVFARRLAQKYGGTEFWRHDLPGERRVIVTIDPVRVRAVDMSG
jgi:PPOX class probable F420-dependent enzyme